MNAIRKVLLAADGTPHSANAARFVARMIPRDGSAEVDVLTVLSYGVYPEKVADGGPTVVEMNEAIDDATIESVDILHDAGIKTRVAHRYGSPVAGIIEESDEWEPELIVLGSRGLRGTARMFGASVSQRVVRETNRPVLIVPLPASSDT
ncbi:MAG TPA: universal stress protein [Actinomycetota bacterium]